MTVNVGTLDRMIRGILGIVLLALPFVSGIALFDSTLATIISVVIGLVMLKTSVVPASHDYHLAAIPHAGYWAGPEY
jgi:hypothetical protein